MAEATGRRCRTIMEMLLECTEGLRGEDIASRLNVSSRTVRSDIRKLQELLAGSQSELKAIPNRGYLLDNRDGHEALLELVSGRGQGAGLAGREERRRYLMSRFLEALLTDRTLTQLDLAEEMYISVTSLKSYLSDFQEALKEYDVSLGRHSNEGMKLRGEETDLRRLVVDHQREHREEKLEEHIFAELSRREINELITQVMEKCNLQFTDVAREKLCLKLGLAIQRSMSGHLANYPASLAQKLSASFEYSIARELANIILRDKGLDVAYNEVFYITQCLMTSKKLVPTENLLEEEPLARLMDEILLSIRRNFGLDFMEDFYLREGLSLHIRIAIAQVKFRIGIRNAFLSSIKNDYPLAFRLGVVAAKVIWEREKVHFNENEIGYLALHFGAAMSRNKIEAKDVVKNVIIVCSAGLGVSMLLKEKVKEYFHYRLNIIKILPAYELTEEIMAQADYVFSTVNLPELKSEKIIRVNHMLRQEDIDKIEQVVFHQPTLTREILRDFFDERLFFLDRDFESREECLEFLTGENMACGFMSQEAARSVFEREQLSPTSIGNLAAIPHPLETGSNVSKVSVLVLKKPVTWGDLPVQIVFLLNIEQGKAKLWECLFLRLYDYIKKRHGLSSLLKNRSFEHFLQEFMEME